MIALLAVSSSLAVVLTREHATTTETQARAKNVLSVFREEEVTRLELGPKPRVTVTRAKDDAGQTAWNLEQPVKEQADPDAVERIVAGLGFMTVLRRSEEAPAAVGIDSASPSISLQMGRVRYELRLGKPAEPPKGARYIEVRAEGAPGSGVVSIGREGAELFATTLDQLRRRTLWPYGPATLRELSIDGPQGKLALVRDGSVFELSSGKRASRDALDPVFLALARISLSRFLEPATAESLLAGGPRHAVRGVPLEGPTVELELGASCPGAPDEVVVLRRGTPPLAGCTEGSVVERLKTSPDSLLDRQPFSMRPDEVEELELKRDGQVLALARKGSGFVLRRPAEAEISLDAGNARIASVVRAPATIVEAPDLARLGLAPPSGRALIVSPAEGKAIEESVAIGRPLPDGTLHLQRSDGVVLALGRDAARAYAVDSTLLRGLKLLDYSSSDVDSVTLSQPEPQEIVRSGAGQLELVQPAGFDIDSALAADLTFALGSLEAARWVADRDDGSFGLERPALRAQVAFSPGDAGTTERTLLVGSATSGGHYARFEHDAAVFVLEPELIEKLSTLLIDRSKFLVDPADVERIELAKGNKRVSLAARDGNFVAAAPSTLSQTQAQAVVEALSTLRAEAALHTGQARPEEGFARPELEVKVERKRGAGPALKFSVGASDAFRGVTVAYARVQGVNATFAIARNKLRPLLDAF